MGKKWFAFWLCTEKAVTLHLRIIISIHIMKISYKWLKEYVDFDLTPQQVAEALTSTGLEVGGLDEVQAIPGGLKGLFVGKVLTCVAHPNSDHLHITTVDLGKEAPQQIVCGAPNVAEGQKVIVADLGCVLYDGDKSFTIKRSKLRGVESLGMICAEDEIGVGHSHDGIIVLPEDAPVGQPAAEYYHLESDWVIDIDITANRADCQSVLGIAREVAAALNKPLKMPATDYTVSDYVDPRLSISVEAEDLCPRYIGHYVRNITPGESPRWMKRQLALCGLRSISNVVDITNYVMLEIGQPMHAFDMDTLESCQILVRRDLAAQPEEGLFGHLHQAAGVHTGSGHRVKTAFGTDKGIHQKRVQLVSLRPLVHQLFILAGVQQLFGPVP